MKPDDACHKQPANWQRRRQQEPLFEAAESSVRATGGDSEQLKTRTNESAISNTGNKR